MIEDAYIHYWAEATIDSDTGELVITGDHDGTETVWPVRLTPEAVAEAHIEHLFKGKNQIKGLHPSNHEWLMKVDDYDSDSTDWAIQYLVFGEIVYG